MEVVVLGGLVTHPFLAALARDLDATRVRAVRRGQAHVTGTGWHTANLAVHADAVVLAAGLEGFSTAIDHPSQVTCLAFLGLVPKCFVKFSLNPSMFSMCTMCGDMFISHFKRNCGELELGNYNMSCSHKLNSLLTNSPMQIPVSVSLSTE